jgi:uncharacterized membrane protein
MKPLHFIKSVDRDQIVAAIADAETRTTGRIRVFISHHKTADAMRSAGNIFAKLKLNQVPLRNAVLIFIAPVSHKFAVMGDTGVHAKCGDEFWRGVVETMEAGLKRGDFTDALVHGVKKIGSVLAEHFPPDSAAKDDLSDAVVEE